MYLSFSGVVMSNSNGKNRKLLELESSQEELFIGLVGAVGSRIDSLANILKSILVSQYDYETVIIKVSKDILQKNSLANNSKYNLENPFERISSLMDIGNELRQIGLDYIVLQIIKTINEQRKVIKNQQPERKRIVYIINSLKHEEEIKVLRKIYGNSFFQISLYESDKSRENYLINEKGITLDGAKKLIERDKGEDNLWGQHTSEAFHLADYFVKFSKKNHDYLKEASERFLKLIFSHPYITPTFQEFSTYMAFTSSLKSADLSRQVGAVITNNDQILATGANDVPKPDGGTYWPYYEENTGKIYDLENSKDYTIGYDPNHKEKSKIIDSIFDRILNEFPYLVSGSDNEKEAKKKQLKDIIGTSELKNITEYGRIVHAEMDAILSCARNNISTQGATLYVTTFPCHNCAKHIVAAGIKKVIFVEPYPKSLALDLHSDSISYDEEVENKVIFKPFVGVGARSFLNLFSMTLTDGSELKRKVSGQTIKIIESNEDRNKFSELDCKFKWDPKTARLRMPLVEISYSEIEYKAIKKLEEVLK